MAHDILEHLHDSPREFLERLIRQLKEGGLVYISVPNAVLLRKRPSAATGRTHYAPYIDCFWYPESWRRLGRECVKGDLLHLSAASNLDVVELAGFDDMLASVSSDKFVRKAWKTTTSKANSVYLVAQKPEGWELGESPAGFFDGFLNPRSS